MPDMETQNANTRAEHAQMSELLIAALCAVVLQAQHA